MCQYRKADGLTTLETFQINHQRRSAKLSRLIFRCKRSGIMHLRPYRPTDLSTIADIVSICNVDDTSSRYMTKDIFDSWLSYRQVTLRWLRNTIASPGAIAFVIETEDGDTPTVQQIGKLFPPGQVIGCAIWTRSGSSPTAEHWQRPNSTWLMTLEQRLFAAEGLLYEYIPRTNPTWDVVHNRQIAPILHEPWDPSIFAESWELNVLYIDVDWQRQGAGSSLIQWGLEQGQKEHVPVVVSSSPRGIGAYEKKGFRRFKRLNFDQYFISPEPGIWKLVWEPKARAGNWLERALEAERDKKGGDGERKRRSG